MAGPGLSLHRKAQRLTRRIGAAITWTKVTQVIDEVTELPTGSTSSSVSGHVIQLQDDLEQYHALGLTVGRAVTLQYSPQVAGEAPELGATGTLEGQTVTALGIQSIGFGTVYRIIARR